jgi:hypothetical protein
MALSSNVPLCAAGDCYEQLSIEGSPASPRRAADGGQGFNREPRTMELRRTAVQRLALKYGTGRNGTQLSGA